MGRLLDAAGADSDTLVMVMSDHGFGPVHSFFLTNNWLASMGLLRFKRTPWTVFKRLLFFLVEYKILKHKNIHFGTHKAKIGILWCTDNRFTANIE